MNIFFLAWCAEECAQCYSDKHVVKIILEIAQMLYCAHHMLGGNTLPANAYKATHKYHPMSVWVRECSANYVFACKLGKALCAEYTVRYAKMHKTERHIDWLAANKPAFVDTPRAKMQKTDTVFGNSMIDGTTPIPLCMPPEFHCEDAVESYRKYYKGPEKREINVWKHCQEPEWYNV
jgi:hypothetical protein